MRPRSDTTIAPTRCPFHHCPDDQCPPLDPDLGDLIPDLLARAVPTRLVPALPYPVPCEDCIADDIHPRIADAIAWVCHTAPASTTATGWTYRAPICAEHLWQNVIYELRRGARTRVEIPHDFWPVP